MTPGTKKFGLRIVGCRASAAGFRSAQSAAAFAHHHLQGLGEGHAERGVERLQSDSGIRTVDQHLHLRGLSGAEVAGEMRRNLQPDISAAFPNLAREFLNVLDFTDNPKRLRINQAIDELPALDRAILIQDRHRHVSHIVVERVTERDHLDERRKEHEEERHRIPHHGDEFLEQNGAEAAEGCALHGIFQEEQRHRESRPLYLVTPVRNSMRGSGSRGRPC